MRECYSRISEWNDGGFNLSLDGNPQHLVFTNIKGGVQKGQYRTHEFDVSRFGLLCDENPEPFLMPYGSVFCIDEAQRVVNSRSGGIKDHVSVVSEIKRHNAITIIMACQRIKLIDVNYRDLFHKFIEVLDIEDKQNKYSGIYKIVWTTREFYDSREVDSYVKGESGYKKLGKIVKYSYDGDIFKTYNSTACEPAFYAGAEKLNYEISQSKNMLRNSDLVKNFIKETFNLKKGSKK